MVPFNPIPLGAPRIWKNAALTLGILAIAVLTLGSLKPDPQFVATAQSLHPVAPEPVETVKPVTYVKKEQADAPAPSQAPAVQNALTYAQGQGWSAEQCTEYVCRVTGICQNGNAGSWAANSSTGGRVMIMPAGFGGAGGAGHVGQVVRVDGNRVLIRDANWGATGETHWVPNSYQFVK